MYLADTLRIVRDSDLASPLYQAANFANVRDVATRILDDYSLYAFEPSAMAMAADLRIDTSERLTGILTAILREKRKIFLEANYDQRRQALSLLRGFPESHLPEGRYNPERAGIALNCEGNGKATIELAWSFPRAQVKREMGDFVKGLQSQQKTRLEKDAVLEMSRLGVSTGIMTIDLSREPEFDRQEFQQRLDAKDPKVMMFRHSSDHFVNEGRRGMTKRQLDNQAWRDYHMNSIATFSLTDMGKLAGMEMTVNGMSSPEEMIGHSQRDFDGELVYMVCLAAVLEADTDALRQEVRQGKEPRRRSKPVSVKDIRQDRLSVVSMNVSDKALMRALGSSTGAAGETSGESRGRIRHPVRGHLFKARNGKIVFRKPHWRGSLLGPEGDKKIVRVK